MTLAQDIQLIGRMIDAYAVDADRRTVADGFGIPDEMQVGEIDDEGWAEWQVIPSDAEEAEVVELEREFGIQLPPFFRAYLLARFHLFDQVKSRRYGQIIMWPKSPPGGATVRLCSELSAWQVLLDAGYIPFAEWGDGWGPMCFDTVARGPDGECPVVWLDHEPLHNLGEEAVRNRDQIVHLAKPLYASSRELIVDIFGRD